MDESKARCLRCGEPSGSTFLVIAHEISTSVDFDRTLVIGNREVGEFATLKELRNKGGVFKTMCMESGEAEKMKSMIFGLRRFSRRCYYCL